VLALAICLISSAARAEVMVAAHAGALMPEPFSTLGAGFLVGAEAGWIAPVWKHRLAVAVELGFGMPDGDGQLQSPSTPDAVRWHASVRETSIGASLTLRQPIRRWVPYLGVGPRLLVIDALVNGRTGDARVPTSRETSLALGVALTPGVGLSVGPGQLFAEVPVTLLWRVGRKPQLLGDFNPSGIGVALGYRVIF
jgi:hypothetical protein